MSADTERLPPPNEPAAFESLCLDLWKEIWDDHGAQKNGRRGQEQAGVDAFGRHKGAWIGVQCKQKDGLLWKNVSRRELDDEVEKAKSFQPSLTTFILATSGPVEKSVQNRARQLTDENRANGLFTVEVWSWEKIWHELYGRRKLLKRIQTVYWPNIGLKHEVEKTTLGKRLVTTAVVVLATCALMLAAIYVINLRPQSQLSTSKSPENLSEKRRDIRQFIATHVVNAPVFDSATNIETVYKAQTCVASEKANRLAYGLEPMTWNNKQSGDRFSDFLLESLAATFEREIPHDLIKEALAFDATPEGKRMLEGHHKMAQRFAEESSSDSKSAEEADRRIVEGTATDDDLLRLAGPRIPPYMAELFLSNRLLLAGILPEQEIVPQQQLERVIGTNAVQALQRNGTVWKNAMIETLSKLIEEEFTLDEIRFQIRYYEEHPRLRDMMAKIPQLMSRALKNPDPITSEKFRRLQGKRK